MLIGQVSGSLYVTSNSTFFYTAHALDQLNKWLISDDVDFRLMAIVMKKKIDKYWGNIEKIDLLIYMGIILDPKVKLIGLKLVFTQMYGTPKGEELGEDVYSKAYHLFNDYRRMYVPFTPHNDETTFTSGFTIPQFTNSDLKNDIEDQVKRLRTFGRYEISKFDRYLNEQLGKHELELEILT